MTKRFVSWEAVSTRPQIDGGSPQDQRERNMAHIEKWGGVLIADLEVPGQSRSYIEYEEAKAKIEAYRQLDALIKAKAFDVLTCYNVGRLGRKRSLMTTVIDLCYEAGILVYRTSSPPQTLEFTQKGYSELLIEAIEAATFQNEVDQLREHHRTGMIRRTERGNFPSSTPFGWLRKFDESGNPYIVIDEAAAEIIRALYDLYLSGKGQKLVADGLNAKGYRTPQGLEWGIDHVFALLRQVRIHAGYVELNRVSKDREYVIAKGQQPPIISEETMQSVIAERSRRASEHRTVNTPYLFSGLVDCERCNWRMHADRYYGKQRHPALCCAKCHRSIAFPKVKAAFLAWFEQIAQGQGVEVTDTAAADKIRDTATRLQKQIEATEKAISRAHTAYVDGVMGEETYRSQVRRKETERAQLAAQLDEALLTLRSTESHRQRVEHIADIAEIGKGMLEHQDTPTVNAWLREFFTVKFGEDREIKITLK